MRVLALCSLIVAAVLALDARTAATAAAWYDRALAADPNHLSTWGYSGALYVVQGDIAKARAALDRIKSICGGAACREYQELASLIAAKAR